MKKIAKIVFWALLLLLVLQPHVGVSANAPMPPVEIWVALEGIQVDQLEAIQLVGYQSERGKEPVFLYQYGVCNADKCIEPSPSLRPGSLECVSHLCRSASYYERPDGLFVKIIIQRHGDAFESNIIALNLSSWREVAIAVQMSDNRVLIEPDDDFSSPELGYGDFAIGLGVTLATELLIGAIYLWLRLKLTFSVILQKLFMIFMMNLGTFPIVWLVFPGLRNFQSNISRTASFFYLIIFLLYLYILVVAFRAKTRKERKLVIIGGGLILLMVCFVLGFALFVYSYGNDHVSAFGIPLVWVLVLSEAFVFVSEAVLLRLMDSATFSKRTAMELSLIMNSASILSGWLVLWK